jgi:hypothetical protein
MGNRSKNPVTSVDIAGHAAFGFYDRRAIPLYQNAKAASASIQKGRTGSLNEKRESRMRIRWIPVS